MPEHSSHPAPDAKPAKPLDYKETVVVDGWKRMAAWKKVQEANGWRLVGGCPRCGHRMSKYFPDRAGVLEMRVAKSVQEQAEENIVRCNCNGKHPGRTESGRGCGALWGVEVSRGGA